ncbi:family 10 glycosylhydrolase [Ruminococcus sp.]|uniref:glycoside hydrolase family 10 protein n=1 Tax=Ruminococcus sp. TaxID=41978 RepID=UPI0025D23A35|nr:family 10 glycosylhydrolase [Ruminococcus sp.]MCR4638504.1 family 10 glycosylhydrolase [Ruminococcus sp.]
MKKIIAAACAAAFLFSSGCSAMPLNSGSDVLRESLPPTTEKLSYTPLNYTNQVGMWLPYVRFPEIMQGKSEEQFRKAIRELLQDAAAENVNTLYFHAHPMGDAYYRSEIFPKGAYLDGDYDPLRIVLDEAHKLGISVHGWINPLRLQTEEEMNRLSDDYIIKKWISAGEPYVRTVNGRWYLVPSYSETVELLEAAAGEILDDYDVDGLHIDDYFYPTTDEEFDRAEFEKSGITDLNEWRTDTVSRYVKALYDTVKSHDERLLFGISPQGSIDGNYSTQYADVRRWGSESGFADYIVPQIYFGFENECCPFLPTLAQWEELVGSGVSLIAGLAPYKLGREDKWAGAAGELEWINDPDIIDKQIAAVKNSKADGYALYY